MIASLHRMPLIMVTVASLLCSQESTVLNESIKPVFFETAVYPLAARLLRVSTLR